MKICLTVNSSPWSRFKGGGQIAVHHLASALGKLGHDVLVLYSKNPDENMTPPPVSYRIRWVRHFNVATFNLNIFSFGRELCRLAREERFDVVHGNAEEAFFSAGVCRRYGATPFFTSHAPWIPPTGMPGGLLRPLFFLKNLNFYLLRSAAAGARRIVVFSRFSKNLVLAGLGKSWETKVDVVPPGVDPSWLETERKPAPEPHLVFWGRLEDEKGIPELLRAMKIVAGRVPQARLTLAGEGNRLDAYKQMARALGIGERTVFAGWMDVREIQALAARSRLGVFPSRVESFGLAVAEALAAGLPAVATRAGALPEIVEDGATGTLVPIGDETALAQAILRALEDERGTREMAERGRETVREKFSWDATAQKLVELYRQEIGKDGLSPPRREGAK